jgi:hypothetical protein
MQWVFGRVRVGGEADFSAALPHRCVRSFGRNVGFFVVGEKQTTVLRLRGSQNAVSNFAQDDNVFWLEGEQATATATATATAKAKTKTKCGGSSLRSE